MKRIWRSLLFWGMLVAFAACGQADDPTMQELYRAKAMGTPPVEEELGRDVYHRDWDLSKPDRGNFTFFSVDVKDLQVTEEKALRFQAGAAKLTLGWGNYLGKQPYAERAYIWSGGTYIVLKVKQSATESIWTVAPWVDGKRRDRYSPKATLKGTDWQELKFETSAQMPADGFELTIEGPQDNIIEMASVRLSRWVRESYYRKEFQLPPGGIWRAVADVHRLSRLYVNGQEIETKNSIWQYTCWGQGMYQTIPVDLAPHLKPGKNCIGLFAAGLPSVSCVILQGTVVMTSGEVVRVDSDETWQTSLKAPAGWSKVGFDAQGWEPARAAGISFHYMGVIIPSYDGRLVIENPYDPKLFYVQEKPVVLSARVPEGLAAQQPTLAWTIERASYGETQEQSRGEVQKFRKAEGSLIYEVNAGRLERGVYTVALTLRTGEEIIEERYREPFIVVGKIPMKEVAGKDYEEGMKLTLEDTVDFTNPQDPHPWVESDATPSGKPVVAITTPQIVRKDGLVYRETKPRRSAMFSYRVQFQKPDSFYLMVLEYPNDSERFIGVSCTSPTGWQSKAGPSIWTGEKYPLTNTMQELRWVYRPGPGPHTVDIVSMQRDTAAAARKLRIYRIQELSALKINDSGQRWLGLLDERTTLNSGFSVTFGIQPERMPVDYKQAPLRHPIAELVQCLVSKLDGCEAYTRYLRFTGQNLHVMGCFQYDEPNTPFTPERAIPTSRLPSYGLGGSAAADTRDIAVRVFGQNGIDVLASIEYGGHKFLQREFSASDAQVAHGADTLHMVNRNGQQQWSYFGRNHVHPKIERLMLMVVDDLTEKFKDQPNFLGINWTSYIGHGLMMPSYPLHAVETALFHSYDDVTVARFEKDTKTRVAVDAKDPQRFQKRYTFLTSPEMREKWIAWRCQKIREFALKARDLVRTKRRDLNFFFSFYIHYPHTKIWMTSGKPWRQFLRESGYDPSLYRNDENLWFTRWTHATLHYAPAYRRQGYAVGWEQNVGKEFLDLYARKNNRAVMVMHHWDENTYRAPDEAVKGGWPFAKKSGRLHAQPNGDNAREAFTQALIASDPQTVFFGLVDVNMLVGHEQQLREFARVLRALPGEQFSPVLETGFETNFAIRDLSKGGAYYFYVANPGYWPIRGNVTLTGAGRVVDLAANQVIKTKQEGGRAVVSISLKPFGIAAYRVAGGRAKVVSWKTEPVSDKDLAHLRGIVERAGTLVHDPKVVAALLPEELAFMQKAVTEAQADLAAGNYARPWSTVTHWRFWILLHEQMEKAAQLAAGVSPGGKPIDAAILPALEVAYTKAAPKIDGKLNDEVWERAKPMAGFVTGEKRPTMVATTVRMAYDARNIYAAFECVDPDPSSVRRTAESEKGENDVWQSGDDAIAMFLQPDPQKPIYYQMAFTAGAVKFDQQVVGGHKKYDFAPPWEVATSVIKNGWTAEAMIPLASLLASAHPGTVWRGNFFRRFRSDQAPIAYWSWVPTGGHDMDRFGQLCFLPPG